MFVLIWYSVSTTIFQMIRSKVFISDCGRFFDTIVTFIQNIAGWVVLTGKNVAQVSNGISSPVIAGIVYWLIRILVCGVCCNQMVCERLAGNKGVLLLKVIQNSDLK